MHFFIIIIMPKKCPPKDNLKSINLPDLLERAIVSTIRIPYTMLLLRRRRLPPLPLLTALFM